MTIGVLSGSRRSLLLATAVMATACLLLFTMAAGSSSSSSSSSDPNAEEFYTRMTSACPAGTLSQITPEDLYAGRDSVCCQYYTDARPYEVTDLCGDSLLTTVWNETAASLNCVATVPSYPFACCGVVNTANSISNAGHSCPPPSEDGDGAVAAVAPALLQAALVAALAIAMLSVA